MQRRRTRQVRIGDVIIGSSHPVAIQAMVKTQAKNIKKTIAQIKKVQKLNAKLIRVAVKDKEDALAIKEIKKKINIPLIADIHFDYNLALVSIKNGADKIRLNPGNIYKKDEVAKIAQASKKAKIAIRVGVNSGSLRDSSTSERRDLGSSNIRPEAIAMVNSALEYARALESFYFYDIVISLKSWDVPTTIDAYNYMSKFCDYPFHLGVTATGSSSLGIVKSSIGIGTLLTSGIGDTIRVSLTDSVEEEVSVATKILDTLGLHTSNFEIISCPTCGRCQVDLINIVRNLENKISEIEPKILHDKTKRIAVMGCVVNGPGEAKQADIGVAFGKGNTGVLFKNGKIVRKIAKDKVAETILKNIN